MGLSDTFETGKSITLGIDHRKDFDENPSKYRNLSLSTVIRNKKENRIPTSSTLNNKRSHFFGSIDLGISKQLKVNYDFAIDDNIKTFDYNSIGTTIAVNNIVTDFNFIEENGVIGDTNLVDNITTVNFDDNNFFSFQTRRNRRINLTEYYDLIYEYKNDCLIAGFKYKKTYYEDRDLKPTEDLMFTITLFPLTTYEKNLDKELDRVRSYRK